MNVRHHKTYSLTKEELMILLLTAGDSEELGFLGYFSEHWKGGIGCGAAHGGEGVGLGTGDGGSKYDCTKAK